MGGGGGVNILFIFLSVHKSVCIKYLYMNVRQNKWFFKKKSLTDFVKPRYKCLRSVTLLIKITPEARFTHRPHLHYYSVLHDCHVAASTAAYWTVHTAPVSYLCCQTRIKKYPQILNASIKNYHDRDRQINVFIWLRGEVKTTARHNLITLQ